MENKKGQALSIVMFFVIVLAVFILAVLLMSLVNSVLEPFRDNIAIVDNSSANVVDDIQGKFNAVWDWTIAILFIINLLLLFFSAFMVDIHPAFLVLYIIAVMFLILFGSTIVGALDALYNPTGVFGSGNLTAGGNAYANMPIIFWLLNNFTLVILGVIIISGVIM